MTTVCIHPFSYLIARKGSRPLKPHQRRDLGAVLELVAPLHDLGFRMGDALLNNPPEQVPPQGEDQDVELLPVDLSSVAPGDYLLQTTRPPLDDLEQGHRKRVERGYTDVEARLFAVWRGYFEICSRLHVKLARALRQEVTPEYANRRQIEFHEKAGAPYKRMNALDGSRRQAIPTGLRTAAFFLRLDQAWKGGPGLIAAFGMDGTSTLVWAYRLARDHKRLLAEPGFTMVELSYDSIPTRATDLRWALDWKIDVVLSHSV